MKLWEFVGKEIKVTYTDGEVIEGLCDAYTQAIDNVPEIASMYIGNTEIYENEIKNIEEK